MTCRHEPGDPNCSSSAAYYLRHNPPPTTPDKANYEIVEVEQVGSFLVLKARYPNCKKCSYEGSKVMVFRATVTDALFWREIDPHFRNPVDRVLRHQAPAPLARFPASPEGWTWALAFARSLASA